LEFIIYVESRVKIGSAFFIGCLYLVYEMFELKR